MEETAVSLLHFQETTNSLKKINKYCIIGLVWRQLWVIEKVNIIEIVIGFTIR